MLPKHMSSLKTQAKSFFYNGCKVIHFRIKNTLVGIIHSDVKISVIECIGTSVSVILNF